MLRAPPKYHPASALLALTGMMLPVAAAVAIAASPFRPVKHTTAIAYQRQHTNADLEAWKRRVPRTDVIRIRSTADGKPQRAIWYDSGAKAPKPLLVVLHSWSADYEQNLNIPFAEFAIANDWAFIHPDFRGPNRRPQTTASDLSVQDVLDAVAYALDHAAVDSRRIYAVGYSGGAMQALVVASRQPELWAGVAAWGTIHDIPDWFHHRHDGSRDYRRTIVASCGGKPTQGSRAAAECHARSPSAQLDRAAGRVPVLIAHGIQDRTVPPRHAIDAYNKLADEDDRFSADQRSFIDGRGALPPELVPRRRPDSALARAFAAAGTPLRLERRSSAVTLALFDGIHDMVYNPTLLWLSQQRR
jgi:pimeloyl-ACP methyl ester carboxylesterase